MRLKNNKAAGPDGFPAELFKVGCNKLVGCMHQPIYKIWLEESMSNDWNLSDLCPFLKKRDPMICANYRVINLPPHMRFLKPYCVNDWNHSASPPSTRFSHYVKSWKRPTKHKLTHTIFLSTKRLPSKPLKGACFAAMSKLDIPAKLIRLCRMTLSNSCSSVKIGMDLSEPFNTVRVFRQGDRLSCALFNFVKESVLRKAEVHCNGTIFLKSGQFLA